MEYTDKEFCLEVWGDIACFTRPELKVERVSYDVITPSATRAIFEAIFWKPAIHWQVTKIEVLNPIKWTSVRRNEVGKVASERTMSPIYIDEQNDKGQLVNRQQKNSLMLKDVRYRIWAKMEYISVAKRKAQGDSFSHEPGADENPRKYYEMFERRASKGQCFNQPYLGTRECAASFRLVDVATEELQPALTAERGGDRDLGIMLYDMDFSNPKDIQPLFYRAEIKNGVINVPPLNSEDILK
jgi:CRISPR-associated protein Cas5d